MCWTAPSRHILFESTARCVPAPEPPSAALHSGVGEIRLHDPTPTHLLRIPGLRLGAARLRVGLGFEVPPHGSLGPGRGLREPSPPKRSLRERRRGPTRGGNATAELKPEQCRRCTTVPCSGQATGALGRDLTPARSTRCGRARSSSYGATRTDPLSWQPALLHQAPGEVGPMLFSPLALRMRTSAFAQVTAVELPVTQKLPLAPEYT